MPVVVAQFSYAHRCFVAHGANLHHAKAIATDHFELEDAVGRWKEKPSSKFFHKENPIRWYEWEAMAQCTHARQVSIMRMHRCTMPAVRAGLCTRHAQEAGK